MNVQSWFLNQQLLAEIQEVRGGWLFMGNFSKSSGQIQDRVCQVTKRPGQRAYYPKHDVSGNELTSSRAGGFRTPASLVRSHHLCA